jgi:hypothetical protein
MITATAPGMSSTNVESTLSGSFTEHDMMRQLYPFPVIRVVRIARDTDKKIGDFQLTADAARQLDEDQAGVLIANCEHPDKIHEKILKLAETEYPAPWVVVLSSIDLARWWYGIQHGIQTKRIDANSEANTFWRTGNCWFTRLERLEALTASPKFCGPISGIILVDPAFQTQHARGLKGTQWTRNDRPELLNSFRAELVEGGLRPPLMFMACPPAKSLNTLAAQRAYCLETMWYADGSRLRIGNL